MQKPEDDLTPKPLPRLLPKEELERGQTGYRVEDLWVLAGLETGPRRPDLHWAAPPAEQSPTPD